MTRHATTALSLALLLAAPARAEEPASRGAASQPEERARAQALFDAAETSYRLGRFKEALAGFEAALKLRQHPSILFNLAQCHRQLRELDKALFYYRLFLADWARVKPGSEPPNKDEVQLRIAELESQIRQREEENRLRRQREELLRIATRRGSGLLLVDGLTVPRAQVFVDGVARAVAPVTAPIEVQPGERRVRIEAPGHLAWVTTVWISAGAEARLAVALRPAPRKQAAWLVTAIAAAALAAGAEAIALVYYGKANELYSDTDAFRSERGKVIAGHVAAGVLAGVAATGLVLYLRSGRPPEARAASAPAARARASATVMPLPGGAAAACTLRF